MNFRNFTELVLTYFVIIPVFYASIWIDRTDVFVRERYYKLFNIPYYKGNAKFGHYIKRVDK